MKFAVLLMRLSIENYTLSREAKILVPTQSRKTIANINTKAVNVRTTNKSTIAKNGFEIYLSMTARPK